MNKHFNKFSENQKGFTIIELIVVIAIIAVLAAIVLVNVTSFINKGKDAAAEGNLSSLMTNGAVFYSDKGSYNGWITTSGANIGEGTGDATYVSVFNALINAGYTPVTASCSDGVPCTSNSTSWCASVVMKATPSKSFCVDSTGKKILGDTGNATGDATCGDSASSYPGLCP